MLPPYGNQEIKAEIINVLPLDPPMEEPAGRPPLPPPPAPRFIDSEDALAENTRIPIAPGCLVKVRVSGVARVSRVSAVSPCLLGAASAWRVQRCHAHAIARSHALRCILHA